MNVSQQIVLFVAITSHAGQTRTSVFGCKIGICHDEINPIYWSFCLLSTWEYLQPLEHLRRIVRTTFDRKEINPKMTYPSCTRTHRLRFSLTLLTATGTSDQILVCLLWPNSQQRQPTFCPGAGNLSCYGLLSPVTMCSARRVILVGKLKSRCQVAPLSYTFGSMYGVLLE